MDSTYRDFIKDGVITYTGKADSIQVYAGYERIKLSWLLMADPRIVKCKVYWNNKADSVEIPVQRTSGVDTIDIVIDHINEGLYEFEIVTYDNKGNSSVGVVKSGTVYGNNYKDLLVARRIEAASYNNTTGSATITWAPSVTNTAKINQDVGTELTYIDKNGIDKTLLVPKEVNSVILPDYTVGGSMQYRTGYLPDSTAIDTLYTAFETTAIYVYLTVSADYNGDGKTDKAIWNTTTGAWIIGETTSTPIIFGQAGDIPVPADYDGDGTADMAVFRPATGEWLAKNNVFAGNTNGISWGEADDIPAPADYNGDAKADLVVFSPSTGIWSAYNSSFPGNIAHISFGQATDIPVPADYNGDGLDDIAIFRSSTGQWLANSNVFAGNVNALVWGGPGDIPLPADTDGDGKANLLLFRPSTNVWYAHNNGFGSTDAITWGAAGDIPCPGKYNDGNTARVAVYRPLTNTWFIN